MTPATVTRTTRETSVQWTLAPGGELSLELPVPLFRHFVSALLTTWGIGATVSATGDIDVDPHHLIEDVGITLGQALRAAWPEFRGVARYGWAIVPMDEAQATVAVDLSGRPGCWLVGVPEGRVADLDGEALAEFWAGLARGGHLTLHARWDAGQNRHHRWEAAFKALGLALRQATAPRGDAVLSTKGVLE
jgi:imidazoleglycerol-phosphate dehydratase